MVFIVTWLKLKFKMKQQHEEALPMNAIPSHVEGEVKQFGPVKRGSVQVRSSKRFCFRIVEFKGASAAHKAIQVVTLRNRSNQFADATGKAIEKFRTDQKLKALYEWNKRNRKGKKDNTCRHLGGHYPPFVHKEKLKMTLKRNVYVNDMYKHFKIGKDGTYFDKDGADVESELKTNLKAIQGRFNGELPGWWRHRRRHRRSS